MEQCVHSYVNGGGRPLRWSLDSSDMIPARVAMRTTEDGTGIQQAIDNHARSYWINRCHVRCHNHKLSLRSSRVIFPSQGMMASGANGNVAAPISLWLGMKGMERKKWKIYFRAASSGWPQKILNYTYNSAILHVGLKSRHFGGLRWKGCRYECC